MRSSDGLFRIKWPAKALGFTGERLASAISGGVEMEHLHRYSFARDFCVGLDVLDLASGEGAGSAMLAGVARHVTGVELDGETVEQARRSYVAGNLSFEQGDALDLPLPDGSVDVVVAFETLQHLPNQARFLAEVKRVLRPGGLLLVGRPDRHVHSGLGMPVNPHHRLELSRDEFDHLLRAHFANSTILAQRTLLGSVLLGGGARPRTYERRDDTTIEATSGVARAVYLVGVASDGPLPDLPASLYADRHPVDRLLTMIDQECADVSSTREEVRRLSQAQAGTEARAAERLSAEMAELGAAAALATAEKDRLAAELAMLRASFGVRLGLYAAHRARLLPAPLRRAARATLSIALRGRAALLGRPPAMPGALLGLTPARQPVTVRDHLAARFPALQPFPCFPVAHDRPRLNLITDSIGPSSLFGGVGTALLLGALLANRLGATLRIVTRTEMPDAGPVQNVLSSNGVALNEALELAFAPLDGSRDLPVAEGEIFLTTSWWTTRATRGSVRRDRVVALVQEDERMFYPYGDERLRCAETLDEADLPVIVNTELLFRHLTTGREPLLNLGRNGMWFEPAFPVPVAPSRHGRRRLFFYARPNNLRNLFWRGVEVLDSAVAEGLFPADDWEMHWVGKDIPEMRLPRGIVPVRTSEMAWGAYRSFIASMDAGFVLMDTPHPSYPPLDLAAAGAAVLTNTHPGKESLSRYSDNILTAPPTRDGLLEGLRRLQALAEDDDARARNRAGDRIGRDWTAALEPVVAFLAARFANA